MNILSLFDGMSCGQIALNRLGIHYDDYFASEIDKDAIKVTQHNFPNTKQLGDIRYINTTDLPKIDLLFGGSPCTSFSFAGKRNGMTTKDNVKILTLEHYLELKENGFEFEGQSYLFWEYVRVLKETKPKYFLLENVMMTKIWENVITEVLGVEPIYINSNLITAQDRERLYWTNIPDISIPEDKNIILKDIVLPSNEVDDKFWYKESFVYNGDDKKIQATIALNGHDILKRVYNLNGKCGTLTCCRGGNLQKKVYQDGKCRKLTPLEYERLQTVPENYTSIVSNSQRYNMLGNGWTVDVIAHIFSHII
jgi:DNA (cytosine-5)-methyltransferase 3A